jgi:uncharacterized delta-60 repeat protein
MNAASKAALVGCLWAVLLTVGPRVPAQTPEVTDFNPGVLGPFDLLYSGGYGPASASCLALQEDGRILVGGGFVTVAGQARTNFARLFADGSFDASFAPTNTVDCLAMLTNSEMIVGSDILSASGATVGYVICLRPDGSVDQNFLSVQFAGTVTALALQPDGKLVVGGNFSAANGLPYDSIARLNPDGTLDTTFSPPNLFVDYTEQGVTFTSLALQPDGRILLGGMTTRYAVTNGADIFRLNSDGSLDCSFTPVIATGYSFSVNTMVVDPDGSILVGGFFDLLNGTPCTNLARLNNDGSIQSDFTPSPDANTVCLGLLADGSILVGGRFDNLAGQPRAWLGRIFADGSADSDYNEDLFFFPPNGFFYLTPYIECLTVQPDGETLVGGVFSGAGDQFRTNLARFAAIDPPTDDLIYDGTNLTWLRGGPVAEVWHATFDVSTNGADWISLGAATRTAKGWQLTGISLPTNATFRARGFVAGGPGQSSCWFVENVTGPPAISVQPSSQTNLGGTTAWFTVTAGGSPPLSYQWLQNGQPLTDGANVSGSSTPFLSLSNVQASSPPDPFCVVITGALGAVTSSVATVTVAMPPQNLRVGINSAQGVQFLFAGTPGIPYSLLAATNLIPPIQWQPIFTNVADSQGNCCFTDTNSAMVSARFIRARLQWP